MSAPPASDAPGLWLSISDLAKRKGLAKQSVAERIAKYERKGLLTTRAGAGRSKLVNLAEFDRVAGETTDLAQEANGLALRAEPLPAAPAEPASESASATYTREQARRMAYQADLSKIDLEERLGKLVSVDTLTDATLKAGDRIVRVIDRLPQAADDFAAALAREGVHGIRVALKAHAHKMRTEIAAALSDVAPGSSDLPQQEGGAEVVAAM